MSYIQFVVPPRFEIPDEKRKLIITEPDTIRVSVPIFGNPAPSASWIRCNDEKVMVKDERTEVECGATYTSLKISSTSRSVDSGDYKLVLQNTEGQVECDFHVAVFGKR